MGLRMKNFNIMGIHWKTRFLGGVHEKPIQGELPKIGRGASTVWQKREGRCLPKEINIKVSKPNLSGKNKVSYTIYRGTKTDYVIFTRGKCYSKGT